MAQSHATPTQSVPAPTSSSPTSSSSTSSSTSSSMSTDPTFASGNSAAVDLLGLGMTPADPDLATAQARQEITDFYDRSYSVANWVTPNGYGAFNLSYEPNTQACTVTVNIEFDFQNAPASVLMKYLGALDFANISECFWTDEAKQSFQDDMVANVDRVWSGQHRLRCTYDNPDLTDQMCPTWQQTGADVSFVVNPVSSGGHFKVSAVALPAADNLRSFVSGEDHDTTQGIDSNSDGVPDRDTLGSQTTPGPVSDANFKRTGANFNRHDNDIESKPSSFDGTTYTVVAGDSLWSIAQRQYGDGNKWTLLYEANKGVVGPDPNLILPGQSLTLKVPPTRQATTAHEFGHMIGLDDQYVGGGGGSGTAGSPTNDGSNTSAVPADEYRIMDGGEVVLQEHYSTVVQALNFATKPVTFST